jgi:aspartate--ammonia ligase
MHWPPARSSPTVAAVEVWLVANSKVADLAGPGIGNYTQLENVLPNDYSSALARRETQKAIFAVRRFIEGNLCKELNLIMVTVPLILDVESGVNDMLDGDGSRTPIQFHIINETQFALFLAHSSALSS